MDITITKRGGCVREHLAAVGVSFLLAQDLRRCGFETVMTGFNDSSEGDIDLSIEDRQDIIKSTKCDYSISIHCDIYSGSKASNWAESIRVYIHKKYSKRSEKLSQKVLKYLITDTAQVHGKINKAALPMCNCNLLGTKGSIVIVFAFMVNENDAMNRMGNASHWKKTAIKICKGISEYTGKKYVEEDRMPNKNITRKSSKEDVIWLQKSLNAALIKESFFPLDEDGVFGSKTRIAVLIYWEKLGWNKKGTKDGWIVGRATKDALVK